MTYDVYADGSLIFSTDSGDPAFALISPKLKLEMGKAGSVEFSLVPEHQYYGSFHLMTTVIDVIKDGKDRLFHGRVSEIKTETSRKRTIYAEGSYAFFIDSIQPPLTQTISPRALLQHFVDEHNKQVDSWKQFVVGNVTIAKADVQKAIEITSYDTTQSLMDDNLAEQYEGYLQARYENGVNYIDFLAVPDEPVNQEMALGLNITDIDDSTSADDIFTVLLPLGSSELTIENVTGSKYIEIPELIAKYGRIVAQNNFDTDDASTLYSMALDYIERGLATPVHEINVTALDLGMLGYSYERFQVGKRVLIRSDIHGIEEAYICKSAEYSLLELSATSFSLVDRIELEEDNTSLSSTTSSSKKSSSGSGSGSYSFGKSYKGISESNDQINIVKSKVVVQGTTKLSLQSSDDIEIIGDLISFKADEVSFPSGFSLAEINVQHAYIDYAEVGMLYGKVIRGNITMAGTVDMSNPVTVRKTLNLVSGAQFRWGNNTLTRKTATINGTTIRYIGW